jgi:SAM-dependent methyltransferase
MIEDWDLLYRNKQPPVWDIGEVQPALVPIIDQKSVVRSEVLDAGCGYAELSLALAARGHTVVGIDLAPTALAVAAAAAEERGLSEYTTFVHADLISLTGYDARFSTIFDAGMLHSLLPDQRGGYLRSMHRAAAPGAFVYILALAADAYPDVADRLPATFTEDRLRRLIYPYWVVDEIRPVVAVTNAAQFPCHLVYAHKKQRR